MAGSHKTEPLEITGTDLLHAECPFFCPTNSVEILKENSTNSTTECKLFSYQTNPRKRRHSHRKLSQELK